MLETEFQYYIDNQAELVSRYNGRFIVIVGKEVVGDYPSQSEAYNAAIEKHELGTFLIQECKAGTDSYTNTFHSRVYIAK